MFYIFLRMYENCFKYSVLHLDLVFVFIAQTSKGSNSFLAPQHRAIISVILII
jgi:hypothetical protein